MVVKELNLGVAPVAPRSRSMAYSGQNPSELFGIKETLDGDTGVMIGYGVGSIVLSSVAYGLINDKKAGSLRSIVAMTVLAAGSVIGGAMTIGAGIKAGNA